MPDPSFKTIGLIIRQDSSAHKDEIKTICKYLSQYGKLLVHALDGHSTFDHYPPYTIEQIGEQADLAISVGGDGTILTSARQLVDFEIPMVGLNLGRLGFLADVTMHDLELHLGGIFAGHFSVEKRFLLDGEIIQSGLDSDYYIALNDIILHSHQTISMIEFEVYSDGQLINNQRADGLIVSTPTGSTAYALSGGGPIMYPTLDVLALVPICPHTLSNRPIVLPSDKSIEIRLCRPDMMGQLSFDGQARGVIRTGDSIRISRHEKQITLLHPATYDYFQILRAKLKWSNHP